MHILYTHTSVLFSTLFHTQFAHTHTHYTRYTHKKWVVNVFIFMAIRCPFLCSFPNTRIQTVTFWLDIKFKKRMIELNIFLIQFHIILLCLTFPILHYIIYEYFECDSLHKIFVCVLTTFNGWLINFKRKPFLMHFNLAGNALFFFFFYWKLFIICYIWAIWWCWSW